MKNLANMQKLQTSILEEIESTFSDSDILEMCNAGAKSVDEIINGTFEGCAIPKGLYNIKVLRKLNALNKRMLAESPEKMIEVFRENISNPGNEHAKISELFGKEIADELAELQKNIMN